MSLKTADIDRVFRKLQMKVRNRKDKLAWFEYEGQPVVYTKRSQGKGDVGHIGHLIRQQLKVNEEQFSGLRNCPVSRDDYIDILRQKGFLAPSR